MGKNFDWRKWAAIVLTVAMVIFQAYLALVKQFATMLQAQIGRAHV